LVAIISLGIAAGSVAAGFLGRGGRGGLVQQVGALGMCATLVAMCLPGGPQGQLLGYVGSLVMLTALGIFTGMFAVPLQVFLQSRPPDGLKGRMIATQNLLNWIGIFVSTGIYEVARIVFDRLHLPDSAMFAVCAALILPVVVLYRPADPSALATKSSGG
jgi:acyl-[acyl-carrier-protein]-phospholipid O-acyltransferase/long-chain-fatty-acid--[acyl-carrier-protein] ligase